MNVEALSAVRNTAVVNANATHRDDRITSAIAQLQAKGFSIDKPASATVALSFKGVGPLTIEALIRFGIVEPPHDSSRLAGHTDTKTDNPPADTGNPSHESSTRSLAG